MNRRYSRVSPESLEIMDSTANVPIRTGIIGSGSMAFARAERIARHHGMTLTAVAARNLATRDILADLHNITVIEDWRRLAEMPDLDAVCICTYPDTHAEMAVFALEHGKHVFTESPMGMTVADCSAVIKAAYYSGLIVRVGHTSVLRPSSKLFDREVNRLGGSLLDDVRIQYLNDERRGRVSGFDVRISGHPFLHAATLAFPAIYGRGPIASIMASVHGLEEGPRYDHCLATIEIDFESGPLTTISYLRGFLCPGPGWRVVFCRDGSVKATDDTGYLEVVTDSGANQITIPGGDPWLEELDDLVVAIRTGKPVAISLDEARRVVAISEAAQIAALESRSIIGDIPSGQASN